MSLNKKLENHDLGSKEFNELKDKILSLELNLKDSNDRLGILKQEIEQRDCSLVNAKKLENVVKSKLNEHLNQEKKYEQWLDKSHKDVMFSDDKAEKYAIELRMLREKLDEANRVISKMSSSSNKVETLIKSGKHPCDKRGESSGVQIVKCRAKHSRAPRHQRRTASFKGACVTPDVRSSSCSSRVDPKLDPVDQAPMHTFPHPSKSTNFHGCASFKLDSGEFLAAQRCPNSPNLGGFMPREHSRGPEGLNSPPRSINARRPSTAGTSSPSRGDKPA
ncbi:hypothetical protein LWI29_035175 [Acer saccharum]|uniref:Uncharacterized protein n=1 Tax=Acer saccharum TaxID=4024 RepID=A0AA39S920_ACESA|nr:hypothetical protein LWI29_035175 [Acer saccharum]